MPRPTLPDHFNRVRSMSVLLTKHTAEEVWQHIETGFANFDEKAEVYINKLQTIIADFKEKRPYDRINWRHNYHTGSAAKHRILTCMWNGYQEEDDYDRLWDYCSDLRLLRDEFKDKEDYERFVQIGANFQDAIRRLTKEYERIEKYEWEMSSAMWKKEDADWIRQQEFIKEHRFHKSVEEQTKNRDSYIKQYPEEREMLLNGRWDIVDYTLTCSLCREAVEEKKRIDELCAAQEAERIRKNEEWKEQKEAELRAEMEEKQRSYASLPFLVCDVCEYRTKSNSAYEQHNESKEHKNKVRDQSLYCEKCDHRSRYRAEHVFHLGSKKHLGTDEPKQKPVFYCQTCDYTAKNKGNYDYHMGSNKHLKKASATATT